MGKGVVEEDPANRVLLPSTISGNQVLSEGIISDILNEHFGEAVELVGIVLLRNGPLNFADIWRICNGSFLAFPRDMLNSFNMYQHGSSEQVVPKIVRDALLVMIHHGLVSYDSGIYRVLPEEIVARMLFPYYLNTLLSDENEQNMVELVLQRGRIARIELVKIFGEQTVKNLISKRYLTIVDSISRSRTSPKKMSPKKDRIVISVNSKEMQFAFLKNLILQHLDSSLGNDLGVSVMSRLLDTCNLNTSQNFSAGDISVSELHAQLSGDVTKNNLVGTLIQLQSLNYVGKKTQVIEQQSGKRVRRSANTKQILSDDFELVSSATPSYTVKLFQVIDEMRDETIHELIVSMYGKNGARVFELLLSSNQKMESVHIADICAISREDALKILHRFQTDGLCSAQEVPKILSSGGANSASGVSAMMRSVASAIWLYYVDKSNVRKVLVSLILHTIVNLRRRFRLEVTRQCKIEDRATVLTEPEEAYLKKVHEAQDILELNAIKLVPALMVLIDNISE